ncbi:hypothetical protein LZG04_06150 [Saccharothrix sp. S26]|uniref:hypothetical protein n=1 Tax=Saccharothrix sp. S26 TaxID=2907215 RepID=UPI001F3ADFEC|nr:hypothetical protein [Saccharothrix sp. S26]MCE6994391.1 hypothetical protein [Saccharothrix sp. S26]
MQEAFQLAFHVGALGLGRRGPGQRARDVRHPQRVVVGDVGRDRRVGAAGDDHPHTRRWGDRQQGRDAVRVRARGHAPVLVQAVHQEHEVLAAVATGLGRIVQQTEQVGLAGRLGQQRRKVLAEDGDQLFQHVFDEGVPVVLRGETGRDEERDHPDTRGRVQDERRHQCRLA